MASLKHAHKLKRHKYKTGTKVFFCTLPNCTYRHDPDLTLGKATICWRCGKEFLQNEYSLRLAKPHCPACHKSDKPEMELAHEVRLPVLDELVELAPKNTNETIHIPIHTSVGMSLKDRLLASIGKGEVNSDSGYDPEFANQTEDDLL